MIILSSSTSLLLAIACVIIFVVIACFYFAAKRKYKQKVDTIASQTKRMLDIWMNYLGQIEWLPDLTTPSLILTPNPLCTV